MNSQVIHLREDDPSITLTTYVADNDSVVRDALLVLPGGGYSCVCSDREGEPIALSFLAHGINAFVLHYSVGENAIFPRPLADASLAMAYIKDHAEEFHIDPERVFCVGFSAGGHLSASLGTFWNLPAVEAMTGLPHGKNKPRGMILCYAVLTGGLMRDSETFINLLGNPTPTDEEFARYSIDKHIDENTVPAFFMHTAADDGVLVENALYTAEALAKYKIPFEMHIYPFGPHGMALANRQTSGGNPAYEDSAVAKWVDDAVYWMKRT